MELYNLNTRVRLFYIVYINKYQLGGRLFVTAKMRRAMSPKVADVHRCAGIEPGRLSMSEASITLLKDFRCNCYQLTYCKFLKFMHKLTV